MFPDHDDLPTQTWPRTQNPAKLLSDYQVRNQIKTTLANLKHYSNQPDDAKVEELVNSLYETLNNLKASPSDGQHGSVLNGNRPIGMIREEPHFESMISVDNTYAQTDLTKNLETSCNADGNESTGCEIENSRDPMWFDAIPHILLCSAMIIYLVVGVFVFQHLDKSVAEKPFHEAILLPFQICVTIGWGHIPLQTNVAQLIAILYAIIGVPLTFACLANIGRLIVTVYTVDWILLSAVVRQKPGTVEIKRKMPLRGAINLVIFHLFFGVILFNGLFEDMGVIKSLYFCYLSIAMIGFGDVVFTPKNIIESTFFMSYCMIGIVVLSVVNLSLCYHIQRFYFIIIRNNMTTIRRWFAKKRSHKTVFQLKP